MKSETAEEPIKVLIVDDHPVIRICIKQLLDSDPEIRVVGAVDTAKAALNAAAVLHPAVVLMDINLPDGSGIEVLARIRSAQKSVRAIMFTSHEEVEYLARSLAAGASGYCVKGAEPELLRLAIRCVNAGAMWFDSQTASRISQHFSQIDPSGSIQPPTRNNDQASDGPELSEREREVLELLADGLSNQEVALQLCISLATVKTHVRNILKRLGVADRTQAAIKAVRMRIVRD